MSIKSILIVVMVTKSYAILSNITANGLKKYMAFMLGKKVFVDCMQLMNFSFKNLVQNLAKDKLKYVSKKFHWKQLELVKRKGIYLYEHSNG